jgi:hypothetical protein
LLGRDLDGFAVEHRETVDTELAAFPRTNGVNLELYVGVTLMFTVISSPVEAPAEIANFRLDPIAGRKERNWALSNQMFESLHAETAHIDIALPSMTCSASASRSLPSVSILKPDPIAAIFTEHKCD